jgi:hypothetical protein
MRPGDARLTAYSENGKHNNATATKTRRLAGAHWAHRRNNIVDVASQAFVLSR